MHIAEIEQAAILLSFAIKPLGIRKLKGNSLTAPDRNRAVRLHDVVHASLDGSWCTNERSVELEHLLDTYLVEASRGEGLDLWRKCSHPPAQARGYGRARGDAPQFPLRAT